MPISRQILRPISTGLIVFTFAVALLVNLIPWQAAMASLTPDFVALLLLYWTLNQPRRVGIGIGFLLGLLMDVSDGVMLGQHALAYSIIAYTVLWRQRQIAIAPFWQQAGAILALLLGSQLIMQLLRAVTGAQFAGWGYFVGPFIAALIWTPLSNLMLMYQRREVPDEL